MAKMVDMELRKAFLEMQLKTIETTDKIKFIDFQINSLKRAMQQIGLTKQEIASLPLDTKTYEMVGRMFLMTNLDDVKDNLKHRENVLLGRTTELTNSKQYLEKSLKESEDNLREMVQQKKEQKTDPN